MKASYAESLEYIELSEASNRERRKSANLIMTCAAKVQEEKLMSELLKHFVSGPTHPKGLNP